MSGSTRASGTSEGTAGSSGAGLAGREGVFPRARARGPNRQALRRLGLVTGVFVVGIWVLGAVAAPLAPYGADEQRLLEAFQPPSVHHPFGTDDLGRDVLTRVLYGGRYTLSLALAVVLLTALFGMAVVVALRAGLINAGLAMVLVWWPSYARLARGETLVVRRLDYGDAAVALGRSPWGILRYAIT